MRIGLQLLACPQKEVQGPEQSGCSVVSTLLPLCPHAISPLRWHDGTLAPWLRACSGSIRPWLAAAYTSCHPQHCQARDVDRQSPWRVQGARVLVPDVPAKYLVNQPVSDHRGRVPQRHRGNRLWLLLHARLL
jgi:hypothetical protein